MKYIRVKKDGAISVITLARPEKRNALNYDMVSEIDHELSNASESEVCRAVVIKADGDAFCAGADLQYLQQLQKNTYEENLEDSQHLASLFKAIYTHPKLIITQVNGPALAGGCGLATIADFCFASPKSSFGYTEARIGFVPALVMVFLLRKLGENVARNLMLTADIINAEVAKSVGLVYEVVDEDLLDARVNDFTKELIARNSGDSIRIIKQMMASINGKSLDTALGYTAEINAETRESADCKKGIDAFLRKERPNWQ